jgi:hypothetical protein
MPNHHCHFYTHWNYPALQRCNDGHHGVLVRRIEQLVDKSWYVEILIPPDFERLDALDKLREKLKAK